MTKASNFLLSSLNTFIVATIVTLAFFSELKYVGYILDSNFFLLLFVISFVVVFILHFLLYKSYERNTKKEFAEANTWSPQSLGPIRSFEPLKLKTPLSRYKYEVDISFLVTSVLIFFFVHLTLMVLARLDLVLLKFIDREVFVTTFGIFFSYSLILIASYFISYEVYIAEKKGKIHINSASLYAYIFFLVIAFGVLIKFLYDAYQIIFI